MSATTTDLIPPARAPGRAGQGAAWIGTVRRLRDITGSLLLLFLTLPLCLLVAFLILCGFFAVRAFRTYQRAV